MDGSSDSDFGVPIPGRVLPQDQWAKTAIKRLPPPGPLDWKTIFGREAPVVLDVGCGNGRFVIASALARPEFDHIGIEILPVVIRYATRRANQRGLSNVRLAVIGGYEFLAQYVAPASFAEIHLYHPQPWKADRKRPRPVGNALRGVPQRHRGRSLQRGSDSATDHRRLITPEFLALVHRSLIAGGLLVIQTDNRAYWQYIRRVLPLLFEFEELKGPWPDAPKGRTRREIYARQHKLPIFKGQGRPRPELTAAAIERIVREAPRPDFQA
jgi:tRNA (guanine-N7-)-methyltransferase